MKGVVFRGLLEFLREQGGETLVESVLRRSGASGVYATVGTYDVREMESLVGGVCAELGLSRDDALRAFGAWLFGPLASGRRELLAGVSGTLELLRILDRVIHVEVRKLEPGAELPTFEVLEDADGVMRLSYRSERAMSSLAIGLIEGSVRHFGEGLGARREWISEDGREATIVVEPSA